MPFVSWWNFVHTGTLTCPLLPGLPNVRTLPLVLLYLAYVMLLIRAMLQDDVGGSGSVWPILLCLSVILPQDLVIFLASRGEHYIYFLVCAMFTSEEFLFGCQMIQVAVWTWAGISKLGPWFKYVNATMPINSLLLRPFPSLLKLLHQGPEDASPSELCCWITRFATVLECSLGAACVFCPSIGVPLMAKFHLYIFSMVPFASVMEWNVFCIMSGLYLFWFNTVAIPANLNPLLSCFLVLVLVVVPALGQLFPRWVPFLIAYRPYAGNWRWSWHIVARKAEGKLKRLRSLDSVYLTENCVGTFPNEDSCHQMEYTIGCSALNFPHFRPLVPLVEELEDLNKWAGPEDYHCLGQEAFYNAIYGWGLGVGYYTKPSHLEALHSICEFEKGECYVATFEPMGLLDHTAEWSVTDVADPGTPVITGKLPYHELEQFPPTGMPRSALNSKHA